MAVDSIFEILMGLPLFKGASYQRISEIIEHTKFHFLKYLPGDIVIQPHTPCTHIKFIISGSARVSITNSDNRFRVSQTLDAPDVISPDFLFGRATEFPCSAVATEPTGILQIEKQDWIKIIKTDPVFLLNYLNLLSVNAQKAVEGVLALTTGSLEERIALWIITLTQRSGHHITLTCRQRDLYTLFGVQRSSFVATLESMKARRLIDYNSNKIFINSRRDILNLLSTSSEHRAE